MQIPGPSQGPAVLESLVLEPKGLHFHQLSLVTLVHRRITAVDETHRVLPARQLGHFTYLWVVVLLMQYTCVLYYKALCFSEITGLTFQMITMAQCNDLCCPPSFPHVLSTALVIISGSCLKALQVAGGGVRSQPQKLCSCSRLLGLHSGPSTHSPLCTELLPAPMTTFLLSQSMGQTRCTRKLPHWERSPANHRQVLVDNPRASFPFRGEASGTCSR